MKRWTLAISLVLALAISGIAVAQETTPEPEATSEVTPETTPDLVSNNLIALYVPRVLETYDRDPREFTQGLVWSDGRLFQSSGTQGEDDSQLLENELETGAVLQSVDLERFPGTDEYFAEGLALVDDHLVQITWQSEVAFVYDADTFEVLNTYNYEGEGWGLCYNGEYLWMSDGSPNLFKRDAETFELLETVPVTFAGAPLSRLNELECVNGSVLANVWYEDYIVQIDPETGAVIGIIDARELITPEQRAEFTDPDAVLNGIAYIPERSTLLLTGKLWPWIFEVELEQYCMLSLGEDGYLRCE